MKLNTNKAMKSNWLEDDMNHYWGRRNRPNNSKNSRRIMHKMFKKRWKRIADKMTEQEISEYYKEHKEASYSSIKGWVARDSVEDAFNGCGLILHYKKPWRTGGEWSNQTIAMHLPWNMFPNLKWEDEPIEVELIIRPL